MNMTWQQKTSNSLQRPDIGILTPLEAKAIIGNFYKLILTPEEFDSSSHDTIVLQKLSADRPVDVLVKTILRIAAAAQGKDPGDFDAHMQRLTRGWKTIDSALSSENDSEKLIAKALSEAISKAMPYTHSIPARR
jgi:hypothetical protein